MVNAYWMMVRYCFLNGFEVPYSHYEFQEKIGYALLDPENEWPARNKTHAGQKRKRSTTPPPTKRTNRPRMDKKSLCPDHGNLNGRLDASLGHFPILHADTKNNTVCQLHRRAHKEVNGNTNVPKGGRRHVYECRVCSVVLCIPCWAGFHTIECFNIEDYEAVLET